MAEGEERLDLWWDKEDGEGRVTLKDKIYKVDYLFLKQKKQKQFFGLWKKIVVGEKDTITRESTERTSEFEFVFVESEKDRAGIRNLECCFISAVDVYISL